MPLIRLGKDFVIDTDLADPGSVEAYTQRPERSLQDVVESRSARLARFLDETPGAAQAVEKFMVGLSNYAIRHGLHPRDVVVKNAQTHTGPDGARFVAFFDRKAQRIIPARRRRRLR